MSANREIATHDVNVGETASAGLIKPTRLQGDVFIAYETRALADGKTIVFENVRQHLRECNSKAARARGKSIRRRTVFVVFRSAEHIRT